MKILELSAEEYRQAFPAPSVAYNSVGFTGLNASKVEKIRRIATFSDSGKPLLGLTVGEKDGALRAPFSAPFTMVDFNRVHGAGVIVECAAAFRDALPGLKLTLAPPFYAPEINSRFLLGLLSAGATLEYCEWNYHLDLSRNVIDNLTSSARNKLRQAERSAFALAECLPSRAYDVIARNRANRGYELAMTLEQVEATAGKGGPVKGDFFVLNDGRADIAAAVVFHVTKDIAQVIYWGDVASETIRHPMNLLAILLHDHYARRGLKILDIGPSGNEGQPNLGLSDFKDSIGCLCTPRPTLRF